MSEPTASTTTATSTQHDGLDDSEPAPERQAELRSAYEGNGKAGRAPYAGVRFRTLGELNWVLRERNWGIMDDQSLVPPDLRGIVLYDVDLRGVDLTTADLRESRLGSIVSPAPEHDVDLRNSSLIAANLHAVIINDGVDLRGSDLRGVNLTGALVGAPNLRGVDLSSARMDATSLLGAVQLDNTTRLLDVVWNGVGLASVNWDQLPRLGDEADIKNASTRSERVQAYRNAARAYYGLAKALEAQGLTAPALRYRRRQHQLERAALIRDFKFGQWMFSSLLNIVSGYGDRPGRALRTYLAVIAAFAAVYFGITNSDIFTSGSSQPLQWYEAIVLSLTSFHGRGFFPQFSLGDPIAVVAALEAVVGLFIELVLIATFTRRLFER
jgi:uncharacterized protein YjbI with pentapeptide repeats